MKFDTSTLSPWTDVINIFTRMRKLDVTLDGKSVGTEMDLSVDDEGFVTMAFESKRKMK